jgi:hypothetical protein
MKRIQACKGTHSLESTRREICQKTQKIERKQASKGNSLPREHKGRETFVRRHRRSKKNKLAKGAHSLESTRRDIY